MWADLRAAFAFLTILPVGYSEGRKPGYAFAYFPLVGLGIGLALALVAGLPFFSRDLVAFLTLLTWVVLTGGLHLDGFGDSCDGLIATVSVERRLEIMKDPRTGTWAVVGLALLLLGKWLALREIPASWLLLPPVLGRAVMTLAAYHFPYARSGGLGGYFRDGLGRAQVRVALAFTLMIVIAIGAGVDRRLGLAPLVALPVLLLARWAAGRLGGGLTGDVYGALCEFTEWGVLMILAGLAHG